MERFSDFLKFLFVYDSIALNVTLILLPILILVAISIVQFHNNLHPVLIALIPFYIIFVLIYIFTNFTTDSNNFNSTNLAIYGSILFILLPIDLFAIQNIIAKSNSAQANTI
jgi:hypothetical protein